MRLAVVVCLVVLTGCLNAPDRSRSEPPLELTAAPLPEYDEERGLRFAATREEYGAARSDVRFVMEQFRYQSDDLTVGAYIYRPVKARGPQPIVVFNRGSYTRPNGFAGEMLVMANRYAQAGYVVVAPHYRGSNGWSGRDELGGADLSDLMNIAPMLKRLPGVDESRVFLAGESRGGMMVYMALREGFPARAAAVWGAISDLEPLIAPGGRQARYAPMIWPNLEQDRERIIQTRSALRWPERISAPVLIMHGGADKDIPVDQSRRMDAALTRHGKKHRLIVFDDQPHVIGGRGAERDAAAIEWFRMWK